MYVWVDFKYPVEKCRPYFSQCPPESGGHRSRGTLCMYERPLFSACFGPFDGEEKNKSVVWYTYLLITLLHIALQCNAYMLTYIHTDIPKMYKNMQRREGPYSPIAISEWWRTQLCNRTPAPSLTLTWLHNPTQVWRAILDLPT